MPASKDIVDNSAEHTTPVATVDSQLKPEAKATLTEVLTYHVIAGKHDFMSLSKDIKIAGGKVTVSTVSGGKRSFAMNGMHNIVVMDEKGGTASISTYDVYQSNGVINVIDTVLMPK